MGIKDLFQGYNPDDRIYLTVVETPEGELPPDQLRMLLCDARGILKVTDITADFYQGLADRIDEVSGADVSSAAVSISLEPDLVQSYVIEVSADQARRDPARGLGHHEVSGDLPRRTGGDHQAGAPPR